MTEAADKSSISVSYFLGGQLKLAQPTKGYRAGIDPVLLAASVRLGAQDIGLEFGCGPGAALLSVASLNPGARLTGYETVEQMADMARDNVIANGFHDRVEIRTGDALRAPGLAGVDAVFFNPPFFDDASQLRAPDPSRRQAWINDQGLAAWIDAGLKRLREGGQLVIIQRADRLGDILSALSGRASATILPVHPRADQPAKRVVVKAIKVSKAPLCVLPGLILHAKAGASYMPEADAILRGTERTALATDP